MAKPISGTNGNDTLSELNGSGRLVGGNGDDTYIIDDTGDEVVERKNGGNDHVMSYISYQLPSEVENLTLLDEGDLWGSGNELDNVIVGNSGANELKGFDGNDRLDGGDGNDRLFGGNGDDTLIGGRGSDLLDGGAGADVAIFDGLSTDYGFEWDGDLLRVTQITGAGAGDVDQVIGVEHLQFDDRIIDTTLMETPAAVNEAPVATDDLVATLEDTSLVIDVLANDSDPDGDALSVSGVGSAGHGTITINDDGTLTYTPDLDYYGADSFTYTISDGNGNSATASVTVDIEDVNDAPVAVNDAATAAAGQTFTSTVAVLANDHDADDDVLAVKAFDTASAMGGAVSMKADGSYNYTPAAGFVGTDRFSYSVSDGNGGQATAEVTVTVEAEAEPEDPAAMPHYVEALLQDTYRMNYPEPYGTADSVTFTFLTEVPSYYSDTSWAHDGFQAFSAQQQEETRKILDSVSNFANISFVEVASAEEADITFGLANLGSGAGMAVTPSADGVGTNDNDVWLDTASSGDIFVAGSEMYQVLLHETGHVLGMGHISTGEVPSEENNRQHSVMADTSPVSLGVEPQTYMLFDIATLQYIYGANTGTATGDDVYAFAEFNRKVKTIWDSDGHDVLDMSAASYGVVLDLREGEFSTIDPWGDNTLAIAFGTVIEDAVGGAYDDLITGNDTTNRLTGGDGDDVFVFAAAWGDDTITDFVRGEDALDFSEAGLGYSDLTITSSGGDTILAYGDDSVLLEGVATIDQGDFLIA